jgi:hypothetical protein
MSAKLPVTERTAGKTQRNRPAARQFIFELYPATRTAKQNAKMLQIAKLIAPIYMRLIVQKTNVVERKVRVTRMESASLCAGSASFW